MKVLLINPLYQKYVYGGYMPLGLGYLARSLLDENVDVEVMDIDALRWEEEKVEEELKKKHFDMVGITTIITRFHYIKWLCSVIKKYHPEAKIVLGGTMTSAIPSFMLKNTEADIVVFSEGEITIKNLISALEKKADLKNVKGISYKPQDKIHKNPPQPLIKNLDEIPFPNWDLFPTQSYLNNHPHWLRTNSKIDLTETRNMAIITARGCPFSCHYCSKMFHSFRTRSIKNIIEEIKLLKKKYQINYLTIYDQLTSINKKRIYDFSQAILKEKLNINWRCTLRVDLVDLALLKQMKKAGCLSITFGIETGSQKILNNMNKKVTVEQAKKVLSWCRDLNLYIDCSYMFGYPGETEETVRETIEFCKKTGQKNIQPLYTAALPNTPLYNLAIKKGLIKNEKEYIENLKDLQYLNINFTNFTDKELIQLVQGAIQEINQNG